jgi:putative hydrolase
MRLTQIAELHSHTIASGHAFGSLEEMTCEAARLGLTVLAVTEHGPSMAGAPTPGFFEMTVRLPPVSHGVRVVVGCEANILDRQGMIDLDDRLSGLQPFMLAGLHGRTPYPGDARQSANTDAIIGALANPSVLGISHPVQLQFPVEPKPLAEAACAHGKLLEVNLSRFAPLRREDPETVRSHPFVSATEEMLSHLLHGGGHFMLNTDAHHMSELSSFWDIADWACGLLGVRAADAVNYDQALLREHIPALTGHIND